MRNEPTGDPLPLYVRAGGVVEWDGERIVAQFTIGGSNDYRVELQLLTVCDSPKQSGKLTNHAER
jgi:hypothetical protein